MSVIIQNLKEWFRKMQDARAKRAAVQTLRGFSDRQLQDLGINRSEIYYCVHRNSILRS